jgi:DNA-binding transcriptional ArsR family regulator
VTEAAEPSNICTLLESLITSKTRVKLLMKLFLNSDNSSHLRGLEREFGESTNAIRLELNRFIEAGLLTDKQEGKKRVYRANKKHPLFRDIQNILRKTIGIDRIIEEILDNIGDLEYAYVTGNFAAGLDSDTIELILVGNNLDKTFIESLVNKASPLIDRKIV